MTKTICFLLMFPLFLLGCASAKAIWRTSPESAYSYDIAWPLIEIIVASKYSIEKADLETGYIRSEWKVKKGSLGYPKSRTRVILQIKSANPVRFDFKVERQKHKSFGKDLLWGVWAKTWNADGNDLAAEKELEREFASKLRYRR